MRQPLALALLLAWFGAALLLSSIHWFRRRPLLERLRPYVDGVAAPHVDTDDRSAVTRILGPLARDAGATLARTFGVDEDLDRRLRRVHSDLDPTEFRLRQLGWIIAATAIAVIVGVVIAPPIPLIVLLTLGSPVLAFLLVESALSRRSECWRRSLQLELPVVSEQLGMLLSAGYSMNSSISRVASRSTGCAARDLRRVATRVGHGVDEATALREWADTADVPAVQRLVGVLALDREAGDLGRLITNEARAARAETHRELVEVIERRTQQVWIPVTVATLVPGLLFLAVPFTDALRLFASA